MKKSKILIVEDEMLIARELEARLSGLGYGMVGIASSGEEAIRSACEAQPDMVLMDIVLKGDMDGIDVASEIRKRFDIPTVYVTAYADDSTLQRAKVTEPYGYILKPFSESEIHAAVEMALYKHQMEMTLREAQEARLLLAAIVDSSDDAIIGWTLRDCLETAFCQAFEHEFGGGDEDHGLAIYFPCFIVSDQPAVVSKPGKGAFNDPALGLHGKTFAAFLAPHDLQAQPTSRQKPPKMIHNAHANVSGVRPEVPQPAKAAEDFRKKLSGAGRITHIGWRDQHT